MAEAPAASVEDAAAKKSTHASVGDGEQQKAAQMIQRNYRGYRERRQLQGIGLDASARWAEVRHTLLDMMHSRS
jgi:hypothetical protein